MKRKCSVDLGKLESWSVENAGWLAMGLIAAALLIRVYFASCCYLNPDEAQHFNAARADSWLGAYQASRDLAHPPLFVLILHATLFLGRTEIILRMPSIVGGTVALWFTFAWLRRSLGEIPALAGLGFMALSPAAISASTEVRQYGLQLFFVCGAIYALERAFAKGSTRWAMIHGLFLLGAILTHYISVLLLLCLGLYSWIRLLSDGVPRRLALTIGGCQLVLASVIGWLYLEHIRRSTIFRAAPLNYLQQYYYAATRETPLGYAWRAISETFRYASGKSETVPFILTVSTGIAILLIGRTKAPRVMGILLILPFIVGFAASIYRIFPFAGTRHQAYLLPFFAAGISAAFTIVHRKLTVPLLLLSAFIAPLWLTHIQLDNDRRQMPLRDMTRAIEHINRTVPPATLLFVDDGTRYVLGYYLSRYDATGLGPLVARSGAYMMLSGRYSLVEPQVFVWTFRPSDVFDQTDQLARAVGVLPGNPVWIVSVPWALPSFAAQLPPRSNCDVKEFGMITVINTRLLKQ